MTEPEARDSGRSLAPARRRQARREVGVTAISRRATVAATAVFLATIVGVPVVDSLAGARPTAWLAELGAGLGAAGDATRRGEWVAANRALQEAIDRAERTLEETSLLRAHLLPPAQWVLTGLLGVGNEQAYPGVDDWLFYRPDVDLLTGPGFLDPLTLSTRRRGGDAWRPPPQPDPRPAIGELDRRLRERGAALLVMPTPGKPSVQPERFRRRAAADRPLQNRSFEDFLGALAERRIAVFDPAPLLFAAAGQEAQYLATDTHWTPQALDRVAVELARRAELILGPATSPVDWTRRPVVVEGSGDIVEMLRLPAAADLFAPQRLTAQMVVGPTGQVWRADPRAPVLLLGDSFTNVYSDASLGWGSGAGLAEQLAYHLRRPVDRIALNAGGAHGSREALARDPSRLEGKRLVIYQFAARELAVGDWKAVAMPGVE